MEKFLRYEHNSKSETTVRDFFYRNIPLVERIDIIDFFKYKGGTNKTNASRLLDKYDSLQKFLYEDSINSFNSTKKSWLTKSDIEFLPINLQTELLIPKGNFKEELLSIQGKDLFLKQKDFTFFFADKLWLLLNDPKYVKSENLALSGRDIDIDVINENVQVWIWVRTLNKIVNVSPFVVDLTTNKTDIGIFSITLNPIHNIEDLSFIQSDDILSYFSLDQNQEHSIDFWNQNIQYNDVVFIRFEKLDLEKELKESFERRLEVDKSELPGQIWDMIGLVDKCSLSNSYSNTDYSISIDGRDFMKLLVEDGSYFLPLRFLETENSNFVFGYNKSDNWFKRNFYDGSFDNSYWFPNSERKISDSIGFIINQLSHLGVTGDEDLFSNYDDKESGKRTSKYIVSGTEDTKINVTTDTVNGVWQIIKLMYDTKLEDRRIVDPSISYVDSTMLDQINKVCQKPFVEFFGDTYGDEFNLVVRQPPFDKESIQSFLKGERIEIKQQQYIKNKKPLGFDVEYTKWSKRGREGQYQLIELETKDIEGYGNLEWDDTFYSWYQLTPNDTLYGEYSTLMTGGLIPIVYFERIAEIFGNHRKIVPDNYLFANSFSSSEANKNRDVYRESLLNDLKYIVESNIYLPFTRKGSITLVKGDRRIKKGIFIKVKPTNEIFYVDSVSNSISFSNNKVDRKTTIQVSRGMIEDYIWGEVGFENNGKQIEVPKKFCYFDIVKIEIKNRKITSSNKLRNNDSKGVLEDKYNVIVNNQSSLAYKNNNPGNLRFANQLGAILGEGGFAKFETMEVGFEALIKQINLDKTRNHTLKSFITKYAPPLENDTIKYYSTVALKLNVGEDSKLLEIDSFLLAEQIIFIECGGIVSKNTANKIINRDSDSIVDTNISNENQYSFSLDDDQFDFFLKRKQLNLNKFKYR